MVPLTVSVGLQGLVGPGRGERGQRGPRDAALGHGGDALARGEAVRVPVAVGGRGLGRHGRLQQRVLRGVGQELLEDVDGRDGEFPVGDAEISQVGPGVAGEPGARVEAGAAELAPHQAERARVEVGDCGEKGRASTAPPTPRVRPPAQPRVTIHTQLSAGGENPTD